MNVGHKSRSLAAVILCVTAAPGVSFGQMPVLPSWNASPGSAKVLSVQGNVSLIKDTQAWAVEIGAWIQPRQEVITGHDGFAVLEVSDGSKIEVFPNSRMTFRHNTGNLRELLDLWIGRAKIHIQKLNGQPNPNRVRTPTAVISVRGTIFDVTVDETDEVTLVYVEEGSVAVQHAILPFTESKVLKEGEYIRVYKNSPLAQKRLDKGQVIQRTLQAVSDFLIFQGPRIGGGGSAPGGSTPPPSSGGPGLPGDTGNKTPVPPPPPPPPIN